MIKNIKNRNEGSAILGVLLAIILIFTAASTAGVLAINNQKMSNKDMEDKSSYYMSEYGIYQARVLVLEKLKNLNREEINKINNSDKPEESIAIIVDEYLSEKGKGSGELNGEPASYKTSFVSLGIDSWVKEDIYEIRSEGFSKGVKTTLRMPVTSILSSLQRKPMDFKIEEAVLVEENFVFEGGTINGKVGVINPKKDVITLGNATTFTPEKMNIYNYNRFLATPQEMVKFLHRLDASGSAKYLFETESCMNGSTICIVDYKKDIWNLSTEKRKFPTVVQPEIPETKNKLKPMKYGNVDAVTNDGNLILTRAQWVSDNQRILNFSEYGTVYVPEINISMGQVLPIDVGNNHVNIVTDKITIGSGGIEVIGEGSLTIYVTDYEKSRVRDPFNISGATFIAGKTDGKIDNTKITFVVGKHRTPNDKMKLRINGWSGETVNGYYETKLSYSLIASNIDVESSSYNDLNMILHGENDTLYITQASAINSKLIFVPYGKVDYAANNYDGSIIAKDFTIKNAAPVITYAPVDFGKFPIEIHDPSNTNGGDSSNTTITGGITNEHDLLIGKATR